MAIIEETKMSTFSEAKVMLYAPDVEYASVKVARDVSFMSADDIAQELWILLMTDLDGYIQRKNDQNYNLGQPSIDIQALLYASAKRIVNKELTAYREFQGDYMYTPKDIREILKSQMHIIEVFDENEDAFTMGDIEGRLDVQIALKALKKSNLSYYYNVIDYYVIGKKLEHSKIRSARRGIEVLTGLINSSLNRERVGLEMV